MLFLQKQHGISKLIQARYLYMFINFTLATKIQNVVLIIFCPYSAPSSPVVYYIFSFKYKLLIFCFFDLALSRKHWDKILHEDNDSVLSRLYSNCVNLETYF